MTKSEQQIVADLQVQSIMFDMEVDWETLELIQKHKGIPESIWITKWKEKRENSDFDEYIDIDRSDDGRY